PIFWAGGDGDAPEACLLQKSDLSKKQGLSVGLEPSLVPAHTEGPSSGQDHACELSVAELFVNLGHWPKRFWIPDTCHLPDAWERRPAGTIELAGCYWLRLPFLSKQNVPAQPGHVDEAPCPGPG
ncbi:MAG: hypothetical protein RIS24_868, partial [Verrucomicrobiota bacterium]